MPIVHRTRTQVRYAETDQMGIVYHGNYLVYFEIGRTDLIRQYGATYAELETRGIRLAVTEATARYREPARYDDELIIETILREIGAVRMHFDYRILRAADDALLVTGSTILACLNAQGRPQRLPRELIEALSEHDT